MTKLLSEKLFITVCFSALLCAGCASRKDVVYLQDVDPLAQQVISQNYEMIIHRDDLLAIMVNSKDPELAMPFNMPLTTYQLGTSGGSYGVQRVLGYLVDANGYVDFPILGMIKAEGLTRLQLTNFIKERLIKEDLIKDPVVTIQFMNFKISVVGEVARPGTFTINGDRVTLLEALSMAGDLTIYGKRDRVAVIRERDSKRTVLFHDLRSSDLFQSPCYYLQQNDIVYVEPNRARAGQSEINQNNSVGVWLSAVSILTSALSLIVTINKE
ncbi:MAG: polysaccharide biosynthesis/export family protein [Tannerellaceae bacterium]|nr:polysaccharide biosynthesis/export family protein [Tannerellaceae bacterium]